MPRYIIKDRVPCWVTWTYHVIAEDEETALATYCQGDYEDEGHGEPEIGDNIEMLDNELSATLDPTA